MIDFKPVRLGDRAVIERYTIPSGTGHQKNHGQQDHDESAGRGDRCVQLQPRPDINAVT